jgi:hypothetical protein
MWCVLLNRRSEKRAAVYLFIVGALHVHGVEPRRPSTNERMFPPAS